MSEKIATRAAYGEALVELGKQNDKVVVLDADLAHATMTVTFQKAFPDRHYNVHCMNQQCCQLHLFLHKMFHTN